MKDVYQTHGAFSWTELQTTDPGGAKKFYGDLFNWKFSEMPMPDGNGEYHVCRTENADAEKGGQGGIMIMPPNVPEGVPPHWTPYVTVDDIDATAQKVKELGGEIIVPIMEVKGVGRMCWLKDPQGGVLAAITYSDECQSH